MTKEATILADELSRVGSTLRSAKIPGTEEVAKSAKSAAIAGFYSRGGLLYTAVAERGHLYGLVTATGEGGVGSNHPENPRIRENPARRASRRRTLWARRAVVQIYRGRARSYARIRKLRISLLNLPAKVSE